MQIARLKNKMNDHYIFIEIGPAICCLNFVNMCNFKYCLIDHSLIFPEQKGFDI